MRQQGVSLDQTSAWILAIIGSGIIFGLSYALITNQAKRQQQEEALEVISAVEMAKDEDEQSSEGMSAKDGQK